MARRRRRTFRMFVSLAVVATAAYVAYRVILPLPAAETPPTIAAVLPAPLAATLPGGAPTLDDPAPAGRTSTAEPDKAAPKTTGESDFRAMLESGRAALARGELLVARVHLSKGLTCTLSADERRKVQDDLARIAEQTLLGGPAVIEGDPLVEMHVIKPGETLQKIAKQYAITDELLARINGIADKNRIRAGQRIKVVKGPFRCVVDRENYAMEVYLQDVFVRRYAVGLGADGGTPTGTWKVRDKLKNPQYYPPRGGKIIAADDPANPLGERWIGLEGTGGHAMGQERYGVHGTIEPDSIGRSASMGCIRMNNDDVEALYDLLVAQQSEVMVR